MTDHSLLEDYADETREHLEELEGCLLRLASGFSDGELLNTIFRSLHTIKGASEYLGFSRMAELTHRLENLLTLFREGQLSVDKVAVDLLIDSRDRMGDLIVQIESTGRESAEIEDLLGRISGVTTGPAADEGSVPSSVYAGEADTELFDIFIEQLVSDLTELVNTAGRLGQGEAGVETVAALGTQVDRLASTAHYMGYDALTAVYDTLRGAITRFAGADGVDGAASLMASVAASVDRIKALFPAAAPLAAMDASLKAPSAEAIPDAGMSLEMGLSADLPAIDASETTVSVQDDDELDFLLNMDAADDVPTADPLGTPALTGAGDPLLLKDYADETREHLEELEGCLLRLASGFSDGELLNTIFRSLHTIKGASEYLGFSRMAELTHRLENLLTLFREGQLSVDKVAVDLLIDSRDRMGDLIVQIESTGRESAEIEDLLGRISGVTTGPAADEGSVPSSVYAGEADTELFDIFIEQLVSDLTELVNTAGRLGQGEAGVETVAALGTQVDRLASTAHYMGYDALTAVYDTLRGAITRFAGADGVDGAAPLMASVAASVDRIKALFPAAAPLAAIDVGGWDGPAGSPSPQASSAPDPIVPDIDEVLSSLPDIDAHQRKQLLSETLDETFAFMQADPETARDTDGLDILSGSDDTEADWPPPEMDGPNAAPLSIMDEFGADPSAFLQASDRASEELSAAPSTDADSETELWPSAPETDFPAPSEPAADSGAAPLTLDFSEPRPEVPAGQATDDVPLDSAPFAARSTIRKSIRVDADKIDDLMNQVGELVVNRSTFIQLFQEMRDLVRDFAMRFPKEKAEQRLLAGMTNRFNEATTLLGRVTGELQEQVMKVRMLPISRLFNRYPRLVHDLLKDADKKVQLQFRGEETELDRMVIEQLVDPMIHIIRNAVDHGIESREARKRKGKPEKGILMLDAYHEGSNVVIEITDDGGGIDLSRIRQKAVEKQLVDRAALERMDQRALIDLIMLPGFSTADSVTHTSGRGVGMDVVKSSLEKINGVLTIDTRQDIGTRFRIKIPLTLAIIPALMIRCGGSHFTLPLDAVQETLRIDKGEIFSVDGRQVMHLDEEPLPLIRLSELLNISAPLPPEHEARFFVVVVKATSGMTGLIVDALLGRQEVVVKPLEDYLQESSGFSGATILGDGSISLILNIDELALMAKEREAERRLAATIL